MSPGQQGVLPGHSHSLLWGNRSPSPKARGHPAPPGLAFRVDLGSLFSLSALSLHLSSPLQPRCYLRIPEHGWTSLISHLAWLPPRGTPSSPLTCRRPHDVATCPSSHHSSRHISKASLSKKPPVPLLSGRAQSALDSTLLSAGISGSPESDDDGGGRGGAGRGGRSNTHLSSSSCVPGKELSMN